MMRLSPKPWSALMCALAAPTLAAQTLHFDIPRQGAGTALTQFAEQAGISVLFPFDAVREVKANELRGDYSLAEGLDELLDGTGLRATINEQGRVSVHAVDANPTRSAPPSERAASVADERTASEAPPPPRSLHTPSSSTVDEVVVTARRRAESLQRVPVSVVSLSGEQLEVRGYERIEQLGSAVPNVSLLGGAFGVNQSSFTMRGIPRVSTFVDGVWQGSSAGLLLKSIVDIERVEVLRGPQGTTFGRDATGGAIRVVTRRPAEQFGATLAATAGSFDRVDVQAAVDAPVSSTLRTKWTLASFDRGGYVESVTVDERFGSLENDVFRADLVWEPRDAFDLRFIYERNQQASNGQPRLIEAILPSATSPTRLNVAEQLRAAGYGFTNETHVSGYPGGELGDWQTRMDGELDATDIDYAQYTLDLNWRLGDRLTLQSLTGVRRQYTKDFTDWDASETDMIEDDRRFLDHDWSQELQLTGDRERVHWIAGLYFWNNESVSRFFRFAYTEFKNGTLDFADVERACAPPPGGDGKADCAILPNQDFGAWSENRGAAAFGEVVVDLGQRLALTVGGRFHDEQQASATRAFAAPGPSGPDIDPPGNLFGGADSLRSGARFDHFTKRLALSWRATTDLMLYTAYAEGYNSGGVARLTEPNPTTGRNETFLYPYDPENINNYELGLRSEWLDRRLRFNATAFYTEWRGIQLAGAAPDPWNIGRYLQRTLTSNVAAARARGLETELRAVTDNGWDVELNVGLLDTAYTRVSPLTADVALGDTFGQAPELTTSLSLQRTWPLNGAGELVSRLDYTHTSEFTRSRVPAYQRAAVTGSSQLEAGAFGLLNLRVGYTPPGRHWELALTGTNLTNERYLNSGHTIPMWGWDMGTVARPREWGAALRVFVR